MAGGTIDIPTGRATLCISVAQRPSVFGITVHNAAYRHLGLDYFYKAVQADRIAPVISAVRALDIRGCSVSMPFKIDVIPLLDALSPKAERIGAVNTIVQTAGKLTGHNTDATGAKKALEKLGKKRLGRVLITGGGGVARAILAALEDFDTEDIAVAMRRPEFGAALSTDFGARIVTWDDRHAGGADLLINASPIGMAPDSDSMPVPEGFLDDVGAVMDVVATPVDTALTLSADRRNIPVVNGLTMTFYQAAEQFEIYTGKSAPLDVMKAAYSAIA